MSNKPQDHEPFIDVSQITENIFLGSSMCCERHEDYHGKVLSKLDIYADIDLRAEQSEPNPGAKIHADIPVVDTYPPSLEQTKAGVELIDTVVKLDKKVFVHCQVGHGRSPTLVIAYFILKAGMSYEEALKFVHDRRKEVHPTDRQVVFLKNLAENPGQ